MKAFKEGQTKGQTNCVEFFRGGQQMKKRMEKQIKKRIEMEKNLNSTENDHDK